MIVLRASLRHFGVVPTPTPTSGVGPWAEPLTKAALARLEKSDEAGDHLPEALVELLSVSNGARLKWSLAHEGETITGAMGFASAEDLFDNKGPSPMEGELNWRIVSVTHGSASLVHEAVFFFDSNDYIKGEAIPLVATLDAMVRSLGLPGWEIGLWQHEIDEEEDLVALERCQRLAPKLTKLLNLDAL